MSVFSSLLPTPAVDSSRNRVAARVPIRHPQRAMNQANIWLSSIPIRSNDEPWRSLNSRAAAHPNPTQLGGTSIKRCAHAAIEIKRRAGKTAQESAIGARGAGAVSIWRGTGDGYVPTFEYQGRVSHNVSEARRRRTVRARRVRNSRPVVASHRPKSVYSLTKSSTPTPCDGRTPSPSHCFSHHQPRVSLPRAMPAASGPGPRRMCARGGRGDRTSLHSSMESSRQK